MRPSAQRPLAPARAACRLLALALLVAVPTGVGPVGCSPAPPPVTVTAPVEGGPPEVPVVLVPGLTGSKLRDRSTGEVIWGDGADLVFPRDGGYDTALRRDVWAGLGSDAESEPRLEAFAVLEELRLGPVRKGVYGPLIEALEGHGYRRGRLEAPFGSSSRRAATLYTFAYDWRRSAVRAAGELAASLERLRRARGEEVLRVDLICQSSGGYVCRWLAKYGGATLAQAESGRAGPSGRLRIRRLVLVGSANGGALRILRELDRGRRYVAPFGRRMLPEVLFTFPSLYEDLPHDPDGLLLDGRGRPLPPGRADLYDVETWRRLGWSAFDPRAARRIAASGREDLFGTAADRAAFLERALARARRVQAMLARDPEGFGEGVEYFLVGNAYAETPRRAVVLREEPGRGRRWQMLFSGDEELVRRPYVAARATGPGDGHTTVANMHRLSPVERAALGAEPFYVHGGHFEMILRPAVHRRIAEFLLE